MAQQSLKVRSYNSSLPSPPLYSLFHKTILPLFARNQNEITTNSGKKKETSWHQNQCLPLQSHPIKPFAISSFRLFFSSGYFANLCLYLTEFVPCSRTFQGFSRTYFPLFKDCSVQKRALSLCLF